MSWNAFIFFRSLNPRRFPLPQILSQCREMLSSFFDLWIHDGLLAVKNLTNVVKCFHLFSIFESTTKILANGNQIVSWNAFIFFRSLNPRLSPILRAIRNGREMLSSFFDLWIHDISRISKIRNYVVKCFHLFSIFESTTYLALNVLQKLSWNAFIFFRSLNPRQVAKGGQVHLSREMLSSFFDLWIHDSFAANVFAGMSWNAFIFFRSLNPRLIRS